MTTPKMHSIYVMRSQKRYPEKHRARKAVLRAVVKGIILPARKLKCWDCGDPAKCYDHYRGYKEENWLEVQPLCWRCHLKRGKGRKEYHNGSFYSLYPIGHGRIWTKYKEGEKCIQKNCGEKPTSKNMCHKHYCIIYSRNHRKI